MANAFLGLAPSHAVARVAYGRDPFGHGVVRRVAGQLAAPIWSGAAPQPPEGADA